MVNRRGQEVESQVHWIFVLIAGALIIGFFALIVVKQKDSSEASLQGKIGQQLDAVFSGAQQSPGTVLPIPTPEITLEFDCNDFLIGPAARRLGQNIVYANSKIQGRDLIAWTLPFAAPFQVANVLYVTGPGIRYYLINNGNPDLWNTLNGSDPRPDAPPGLPTELLRNTNMLTPADISGLRDANDQHIRFIFVGVDTDPKSLTFSQFDNADISAIMIDQGTVTWYRKGTPTTLTEIGREGYYMMPMLYGAIFTLDVDNTINDKSQERYNCVSNKLIDKLNIVASIYKYKFEKILAPSLSNTECYQYYNNSAPLNALAGDGNIKDWPGVDSTQIAASIYDAQLRIESDNQNLQRISCPLLY